MLYRRVKKWISDSELETEIQVEDKERIIPFVEEHTKKCVEFMNMNNDVFRLEYLVRQLHESLSEKRTAIQNNGSNKVLKSFTKDEVQKIKESYMLLLKKHENLTTEVNTLLEKTTYDELVLKIEDKAIQIQSIDKDSCIQASVEELKEQLDHTIETISKTRTDIHDNYEPC
jgi:hypothetical protein